MAGFYSALPKEWKKHILKPNFWRDFESLRRYRRECESGAMQSLKNRPPYDPTRPQLHMHPGNSHPTPVLHQSIPTMYSSYIIALAFVGIALAANSTLQLWLPQNNEPNLMGSIVGSDATATTYSVACTTEDCAFPTSFLVTENPSSFRWTWTYSIYNTDSPMTQSLNCQITDSSTGTCTVTGVGKTSPFAFSQVLTTSFTNLDEASIFLMNTAVTFTAGAVEPSSSVAASTTKTSSSTQSSRTISPSPSSGSSTGSTVPAVSSTGSSCSSGTPSSTSVSAAEGAPLITQAPWVLDAAAVMVYAAM
ncbi:hypothetical protein VTL71DRAFT_7101 [Oculimacula yallundae]|uniref:Uncharacterized protein n=1 Tax=Oculimacula yallundae TaxID=86028 RepID=A0ABR4BVR2_9HELO